MPDLVVRGGVRRGHAPVDVAISDGRIRAIGAIFRAPPKRSTRERSACISWPDRRASPFQRAGPYRLGRRGHGKPGARGWRRNALLRHASELDALHRQRRGFRSKRAALEAASDHRLRSVGRTCSGQCFGDGGAGGDRGVVGFKAFLCDSGLPEFPRADDLTLFEGLARGRAAGPAGRGSRGEPGTHAGLVAKDRAGRGERSGISGIAARDRRVEAIQRATLLAGEAGANCTSFTSAPAAASPWPRKRGRAAWMSPSRPARTTCFSPKMMSSAWALSRSARRRCATPASKRLWEQLLDGTVDIVASDHSPAPPEMKIGRFWQGMGRHRGRAVDSGGAAGSRTLSASCRSNGSLAGCCRSRPERFRIANKGSLAVGKRCRPCDGGCLPASFDTAAENLMQRHRLSPYIGSSSAAWSGEPSGAARRFSRTEKLRREVGGIGSSRQNSS